MSAADHGVDRQRIYEEEKARLEAQEKIKQQRGQENLKGGLKGCLWIIGIIFLLAIVGALFSGKKDEKKTIEPKISAAVRFTGTQFGITNHDAFDWTDVEMTINFGLMSGYSVKTARVAAGETYFVGAMQFTDSKGARFNPFTHKPQTLTVYCNTPSGKAAWVGGWQQ